MSLVLCDYFHIVTVTVMNYIIFRYSRHNSQNLHVVISMSLVSCDYFHIVTVTAMNYIIFRLINADSN